MKARAASDKDWLLPNREPRPVQLEALSRSLFGVSGYTPEGARKSAAPIPGRDPMTVSPGWGHFLEMRLGKTLVAMAEAEWLALHYDASRTLVLSPNKFKQDWVAEAHAAGVRRPIVELTSAEIKKHGMPRYNECFAVVNYDVLAQDGVAKHLSEWVRGGVAVCDESVVMKNPKSNAGRFGKDLRRAAKFTRALSGKPAVQGPHDLWSQVRYLGAENGHNYFSWQHRFCKMGGYMGKQVKGGNPETETELHALLARCSWFATKLDWLGIGPPDYAVRRVKMTPDQERAYQSMWQNSIVPLAGDAMASADQVITALLKLQQIGSGFIRDDDREVHWLVSRDKVPKMLEVKALLDDELPDNHKLFIVAESAPSMALLTEQLAGYGVAVIRGGQKPGEAMAEKERFNSDPRCRVMLGQTKAVKYGHQLMGSRSNPCLTTVIYENTYSLDDRSQCEERNRGQGQLGQTTVIDLTVSRQDERMAEALARKESMAKAIVGIVRGE